MGIRLCKKNDSWETYTIADPTKSISLLICKSPFISKAVLNIVPMARPGHLIVKDHSGRFSVEDPSVQS